VSEWTNIAAQGDIVAAQKQVAPLFGSKINDVIIDSGCPYRGEHELRQASYLTAEDRVMSGHVHSPPRFDKQRE